MLTIKPRRLGRAQTGMLGCEVGEAEESGEFTHTDDSNSLDEV
jgi:hypothetical protein